MRCLYNLAKTCKFANRVHTQEPDREISIDKSRKKRKIVKRKKGLSRRAKPNMNNPDH